MKSKTNEVREKTITTRNANQEIIIIDWYLTKMYEWHKMKFKKGDVNQNQEMLKIIWSKTYISLFASQIWTFLPQRSIAYFLRRNNNKHYSKLLFLEI